MMIEGGVGVPDYQCRQIMGERYLRVDPVLPTYIDIDNVDQIPLCEEVGQVADLRAAVEWLGRNYQ